MIFIGDLCLDRAAPAREEQGERGHGGQPALHEVVLRTRPHRRPLPSGEIFPVTVKYFYCNITFAFIGYFIAFFQICSSSHQIFFKYQYNIFPRLLLARRPPAPSSRWPGSSTRRGWRTSSRSQAAKPAATAGCSGCLLVK